MKNKITAIVFAASLTWGVWVYGATETQNLYRLFLLCLIPTLFTLWKRRFSARSILLSAAGCFLLLNITLRNTLEAEGYVLAALGWMALFVVAQMCGASKTAAMCRAMLLIIAIGAAEAVYGFLQYFGQTREYMTGTLVNRNHFAGLLNMAVAMAVGGTFAGFSHRLRAGAAGSEVRAWTWLTGLPCALMGVAVLLSGSRAGVAALASTLLLLCLLLGVKSRTRVPGSLPARHAWILLVAILGLAAWVGTDALAARFTEAEQGLAARTAVAKASVGLIADHPWLGVGPGMYKWRFRPYQTEPAAIWYDHAHNDYLQVAAEWGVPLAFVFWGLVAWCLVRSVRLFLTERRDSWLQGLALGCTGALLSILLHSFVDFNLQIPTNLMIFCTVLGLSLSLGSGTMVDLERTSRPLLARCARLRLLFPVLLTIACLWAGVTVFNRLVAWQQFLWNPSLEGTAEAVRWDPQVADFYFQMGLMKRDLPEHQDVKGSIRNLERAVALNPYRWDYLNELARGYELSGQDAHALRLYNESIRLNPRSGLYRWRLANYYLRTRGLADAMPCFQQALALDTSYMTPAAHLLLQAGAAPEELVRICPPDTATRLALLQVLEKEITSPEDAIDGLWSEVLAGTPPPTLSNALFHLEYLERNGSLGGVRQSWITLCRINRLHDETFENGDNLLWNGRFELPIFNLGLDWHLKKDDGYSVRLANGEGVSGSTAFRVDFPGKANPEVEILRQKLFLKSDQDYEVAFSMRSEALTSDQGVYFQAVDGQTSRPISKGPKVLGTSDWEAVVFRILALRNASEKYRIVSLVLRREKSWKIDNRLGGTLWLDQVAVRLAGSPSAELAAR